MADTGIKPKVPETLKGYMEIYKNPAVMVKIFESMKSKGEQTVLPPHMKELGEQIKKAMENMPRPVPPNPYDRWIYGFNSSDDLEKFCNDKGYTAKDGKITGSRGEEVGTYSTAIHTGFNKLPFASITTSDDTLKAQLRSAKVQGFNMDQLARSMPMIMEGVKKGQEQELPKNLLQRR